MDRRTFLKTGAAIAGATTILGSSLPVPGPRTPSSTGRIMTVTGAIDAADAGQTLSHEHVMVDFAGADEVGPDRYDRSTVSAVVRPHLDALTAAGGQTLVECTPAYLGRDPELLYMLAEATGVRIVTNTGYYGARNDQHLPEHAYSDTVDELAARWIDEWENGIGDTGIRPGFIKIGVDPGSLSPIDAKLVRAASRVHLETGLTIASHTGTAQPAFEQLAILAEEGIHPSAWIWVHAQNSDAETRHVEAAQRGAWIEFDGYERDKTNEYRRRLTTMRDHGVLDRVLLSHDNGWYSVGKAEGGDFQPYTPIFTDLLPALRQDGFSEKEIHQLVTTNPADAFSVRVRDQ